MYVGTGRADTNHPSTRKKKKTKQSPNLHSPSTPDPARQQPSPADGSVPFGVSLAPLLPMLLLLSSRWPACRWRHGVVGCGGGDTARRRFPGVRSSPDGSSAAPWPVRSVLLPVPGSPSPLGTYSPARRRVAVRVGSAPNLPSGAATAQALSLQTLPAVFSFPPPCQVLV
jgi:hypothetical protein